MSRLTALYERSLLAAGRLFKTDIRYILRGGFWSVAGQVVSAACTLVLAMVVSRVLPKEIYGQYKYILAIVGLLTTLSLNSLGIAVFQSTTRGYDGALQEGFWLNLRWSALMFAGAFALGGYYFIFHNFTLAFGILIGGCLTPLLTSANFANSFLAGKKDFARQSLYFGIFETMLSVAALLVTVLISKSPLTLAAAYFISNTLATLYFYHRVIKVYRPDPAKTDTGMLTYGKHLSVLGVLGGIVSELDQILLFHFVGPAQLAVYAFATGIPDQLKGPLKNLDTMLQARFANYLPRDVRKNMANKSLWLFAFSVIVVAIYLPLAPLLFRILFPAYLSAVPYSQIYVLAFLALAFSPASSYLSSHKLIKEIYISNTVSYVLQIVGMTVGVIEGGMLGLVWAIVIIRLLNGAFTYLLYYGNITKK
jgi:O-antigen/teichoic acid export membrane protein